MQLPKTIFFVTAGLGCLSAAQLAPSSAKFDLGIIVSTNGDQQSELDFIYFQITNKAKTALITDCNTTGRDPTSGEFKCLENKDYTFTVPKERYNSHKNLAVVVKYKGLLQTFTFDNEDFGCIPNGNHEICTWGRGIKFGKPKRGTENQEPKGKKPRTPA